MIRLPQWFSGKESTSQLQETGVRSLGRENSPEKEMATAYSVLDWEIPWTEEPDELQSMVSQRVEHD